MSGWNGYDLDGTIAEYAGWQGPDHIGKPIPSMIRRIQADLQNGIEVKIFTARASVPDMIPAIEAWCIQHIGVKLPVTNIKDFGMTCLYDDRARQVLENRGIVVGESGEFTLS